MTENSLKTGVGWSKMQSKIFTNAELEALEERKKENKKDPTGIFAGRVKPKIIEIFEHWFPQKKQLKKLIEPKKKGKDGSRKR